MFMFQIPQNGWEKLFISFIPTETGKATAKTSKANVRNGSCKWADPIYETTRLLLDSKTKQYDDKLYKVVVGMVRLSLWFTYSMIWPLISFILGSLVFMHLIIPNI